MSEERSEGRVATGVEEVAEDCCTGARAEGIPLRYVGYLVLQEKWVLFIVDSLLQGPLGFNELSRRARGVNTTTLTQRLEMLEDRGLVTKTIHSTMPPRTSYTLTDKGRALQPVLDAIARWSEEHLAGEVNVVRDCVEPVSRLEG